MIESERSIVHETSGEMALAHSQQPATSGVSEAQIRRERDLATAPHASVAVADTLEHRVAPGLTATVTAHEVTAREAGHVSKVGTAANASDDLQLSLDDARSRRKTPQELGH